MSSKGNLIVISAPSGSGKSTLARRALQEVTGLCFSVSHTTRRPRGNERDKVEYFFVSEEEFEKRIKSNAFLEYARVHGHYYGTSQALVEAQLQQRNDVLLDVDVQGAIQVKEKMPEALLIFVLPPSLKVLESRLRKRGLDEKAVIDKRLQMAKQEINYYKHYQYVIINEAIGDSMLELKSIIQAAHCSLKNRLEQTKAIAKTFREAKL